MKTTEYAGIDYGLGRTNRDAKTGIRYGVISQNTVGDAWYESAEPQYPECENPECKEAGMCDCCFDEPLGWSYEGEGYKLTDCLDSDIFILGSPYFTHAQFCSPCVPGAGNLESPCEDGPKTYCLGHDWFEDGKAPYPVYSVETGELVEPQDR